MSHHGGRSFHRPNKQDTQEAGNGKTESKQIDDDEEEDPFDTRIKKSGCADLHYALLDCMDQNKDWRKCQEHVQAFKVCIDEQNKKLKKS